MTRLIIHSLATSLLFTAVQAANPVFGAYATPSCEECLDQTYESCPGDYRKLPYAECMCKGDGGTNFVSCVPQCDASLNEPNNAAGAWYGYCVVFFKEMCPPAEYYLSDDYFNEQCSSEAIASGGLDASTASETVASANPTAPTESTSETATESTSGTATQQTSETSAQSTSGASVAAVPALAVIAGLGIQLININL